MITTNDFKNGMYFEYDGEILQIVEFQHVKPGKGPAFVRTKVRNVRTGSVVDKTFRAGEKVEQLRLEQRKMEYLYMDGEGYVFMDQKTYDQITIDTEMLGDMVNYLMENLVIDVQFHGDEILGIELPQHMELEIKFTEPGEKGNTVSGATKKAELVTGAEVQVPLFVETGEVIRIDTRTNRYIERVNK